MFDPTLVLALVWICHIAAAVVLVIRLYKPTAPGATAAEVAQAANRMFAQVAAALSALQERLDAFEKRTLVQVKDLAQGLNDLAQGNIGAHAGNDVDVEYAEVAETSSAERVTVENSEKAAPRANLRAEAPQGELRQSSSRVTARVADQVLAELRSRRPLDGSSETRPGP